MRRMLKAELERATHNLGMLIAISIGIICVLLKTILFIQKMLPSIEYAETHNIYQSFTRGGFYVLWLPSYFDTTSIYIYYFLGIIVVLPFAVSYYRDKKSGVIKNICNRIDKKKYLRAKYFSVFISGGIAAVVPLIIDFFIVKLMIPIDNFDIKGTILNSRTLWKMFVIDNPYLSMVIIMIIWFMLGGALATISLAASSMSGNYFTIQLIPFFIMMFLYYIAVFLPEFVQCLLPMENLMFWAGDNQLIGIIEAVIIMLITYCVFIGNESKKDVL